MMKYLLYLVIATMGIFISCNSPDKPSISGDDTILHDVNVSIDPPGAGTVEPSADSSYEGGTTLNFRVSANKGYIFEGWSGDIESTQNPLKVTIDKSYDLNLNFAIKQYELTINKIGKGLVKERIINAKSYEHNTVVELTAQPDENYNFVEWGGNLTGSQNPIQIKVDSPKEVTAVFEKDIFTIGDGTKSNPYQVSTVEQLQAMSNYPGSHFIQVRNIDASDTNNWNNGKGFDPIEDDSLHHFSGKYDGAGFTITGLVINRKDSYQVGIFRCISKSANVKNVKLENVSVSGNIQVGSLAGCNHGQIINTYATGTVKGNGEGSEEVGGLVGRNSNEALISNSYTSVKVSGGSAVGGLIGRNWDGKISESYAIGSVSGERWIGGLVGDMFGSGQIDNSYSSGSVSGSTKEVGGLVGRNTNEAQINNSHATGDVTGDNIVGGLVGVNRGIINDSYAKGTVTGRSDRVGGLVGRNGIGTKTQINNSYATGNVSGDSWIGGLAGENDNRSLIISSHASGTVSGSNDYVGGLIGVNEGKISNSSASGIVSGDNTVGGLIGYNHMYQTYSVVRTSFAKGGVSGNTNVGGLVGRNGSEIINAYSTGSVNGKNQVGGLVGYNENNENISNETSGKIITSFAIGSVTGNDKVGGLVGLNLSNIEACYWNTETTGQSIGFGEGSYTENMIGLTVSEMTGNTAKENMRDFNWIETWKTTDNFPSLLWE